ncbi:Pantothenate synthetase [bacterium HR17]|uniref:Pantothenate synthetase n=1 Tax=Candidatus Fervidibacter japonicus TaxID=2035412 RepID=A0A2H5X9N6_9BACT|nr:Pantothenate synthetase [bacterium HR17]
MEVIERPDEMQRRALQWRREGKDIGFVPTMGYFHEGHLALMRRARQECDVVVVSIYVNPLQFGPREDFQRYPRDLPRDLRMAEAVGVDVAFVPKDEDMYPDGFQTFVEVTELARSLEGFYRPNHFRGVATVVVKLLNIVLPNKAYFGEKDFQQLRVVQRMVRDLNMPVEIVPCPTVREPDGLAMSSRNTYLSPAERQAATVLYRALQSADALFRNGERNTVKLKAQVWAVLSEEPTVFPQYVEIVDAETLQPVAHIERPAVVLLAAFVGAARLIDEWLLVP